MATVDNSLDEQSTVTDRLRGLATRVSRRLRGSTGETPDADRRRFLQKSGAVGVAAAAGVAASSGSASALGEDCAFGRTDDSNLPFSGDFGGWQASKVYGSGGDGSGTPVVFVHGNTGDACNFDDIVSDMLDWGWSGDELFGITFPQSNPTHEHMRDQLDDFVQKVLAHTGADEVDIVAHSLGVTGVRVWYQDYDRDSWIRRFVGLAGGNHGVCVCPGCYDTTLGGDYDGILGAGEACREIAIQCFSVPGHMLYEINLPDETPGDIDYYMIRGIYDSLYSCNIYSPYLSGANNDYAWRNHNGLLEQSYDVASRLN